MTGAVARIPGVEFDFGGGRLLVVPPLSFGALEQLQSRLDALAQQAITDPASVKTLIDATWAALKRNYPDMTREEVGDLIDPANFGDVYACLLDVGGLKRREQAEARASKGNAVAEGASTGAGSSPA